MLQSDAQMANSVAFNALLVAVRRRVLTLAFPRLAKLPPREYAEALKQARETNFDAFERIGILAAIAFATYLLRIPETEAEISLPIRFMAQYLTAVPLLVLMVGPLYLRCLRRGLDRVIERRHLAGSIYTQEETSC